jgi:hypothetical protein
MRRIGFAALIMFALALASVAPAMAFGGPGGPHYGPSINVWGTVNSSFQAEIDGAFVVPDGTNGPVVLQFYGSTDGRNWQYTGQSHTLSVVKGQTSYGFSFDGKPDSHHFLFFRVVGDGVGSRTIGRDECGYRVPEAPATPLLLLGAFPAAAWFVIKSAHIRLPRPHLHRIV